MTEKEWLGENNQIGQDIWKKKYCFNNETFEQWLDRISDGDLELRQLIKDKKFLFGGRALSNINTDDKSSYFNCYSRGFIEDDFNDIMQANTDIALTYKYQGGQGLSLSKLRPKGTSIGKRYKSDGIIPFIRMYNETTLAVSQGGSRKGALMISLDCRHKEVEDFITIKANEEVIQKANLSLEIDNDFMIAVEKYYSTGEEIIIHEIKNYNDHSIEYDISPIKIFKLLCKTCYDWADPAILYTNRFRNYNLMEFVDYYNIETSNPCGEQPLPKNFCCNLGSLNLAEFVKNPFTNQSKFDYVDFKKSIKIAIKALDILVDKNSDFHPLKEQKENSLNYRNIGLGVFGYANMLMMLQIRYGSEKAVEITDEIFKILFKVSIKSSCELAKEYGKFPMYSDKIWDSSIIKSHFSKEEIETMKLIGIRNCSLISIAPTGSISTMMGRSGGCEPEYAISYKRKTESLNNGEDKYYDVFCLTAQEYLKFTKDPLLPSYFIASNDINPNERINIQSIMQNHVDTAISSTINLPNHITVDTVEQIYLNAWKNGLKGVTIYRDGCKRAGILTTNISSNNINQMQLKRGDIIQTDNNVTGRKRKLMTGCGSLHCTAFFDPTSGELLETYLSKGSAGGCNNFMIGLSRMISLLARAGVDIYTIVDQLGSCGACPSYAVRAATKKDTSKGACCPIAVGNALIEMYKEVRDDLGIEDNVSISQNTLNNQINCPQCGEDLFFEGGCNICKSCGYSKCS